jgi:hypothetical protein
LGLLIISLKAPVHRFAGLAILGGAALFSGSIFALVLEPRFAFFSLWLPVEYIGLQVQVLGACHTFGRSADDCRVSPQMNNCDLEAPAEFPQIRRSRILNSGVSKCTHQRNGKASRANQDRTTTDNISQSETEQDAKLERRKQEYNIYESDKAQRNTSVQRSSSFQSRQLSSVPSAIRSSPSLDSNTIEP